MFGASVLTEDSLPGPLKLLKIGIAMPFFNPIGLMNDNRGTFGVNMGHLWHETEKIRTWMEALLSGVAGGWVRPHVDQAFAFAQAADAHRYLEERRNIGKVVLTP